MTTFAGHLTKGTHAARPAGTAVPAGSLYSCSDHALIYQTDGTTWSTYATLGSVGGGGAWTLLSTTTLGSDGTIDVSSISGTYNDLMLFAIIRSPRSSSTDDLRMRFNNDSGSNYGSSWIQGDGTGATGSATNSDDKLVLGEIPAASAASGMFGIYKVWIPGYASTTWNKSFLAEAAKPSEITAGNRRLYLTTGLWKSTAAITRVTLFGWTVANLLTGSTLRIYGIT